MPQGALAISSEPFQGGSSKLNLTTAGGAVLVKASAGRIMQVNVNAAAAAAFTVYDSATTAGTAATNQIYATTSAVPAGTIIPLDFPVSSGIVVVPAGTGTVLAVSYL